MAFPLINPKTQFFDSSGSPLSSGSIEFRSPTTNDFINSYPTADDADAQTNENANPLELDSSGRASVYLEDGVKYKIILKDADGVTFWTEDDVRAPLYSATSINTVTNAQTAEESAAGAVPVNFEYPPGHALRYGDNTTPGTTDVTSILQTAIDSGVSEVVLPGEDCLVSKTSDFSADFPGDDQPCLFANNKTRLTIRGESGCRLLVNEHAQGILELQGCTDVTIENIQFIGPADFPNLDGTTGRGEKGTDTAGYDNTVGNSYWGKYKNNSLDTSAETAGGFSSAFPQYSGGTASSWGVWNDGFIGNIAYGLLIHNGCTNVTVRDCKATGFNYVGLGVGHPGDYQPTDRSYSNSTNISFINCVATDNYSAGIHTMAVDGFRVEGCDVSDNGHPDATPLTDDFADPGYGWANRLTTFEPGNDGVVTGNTSNNNVRKGLDNHSGQNIVISKNIVKSNGANGIFSDWSSTSDADLESSSVIITDNVLNGNGFSDNSLDGIYIGGPGPTGNNCNTVVSNNVLENSYSRGVRVRYASNVVVANNVFRGSSTGGSSSQAFIDCQPNNGTASVDQNLTVTGNQIFCDDNEILNGIRVLYDYEDAVVSNNVIKMTGASVSAGINLVTATKVHVMDNVVRLGAAGTPLAVNQTEGVVKGNVGYGGATDSTILAGTKELAYPAQSFSFNIDFNNTSTPAISSSTASSIVGAASSTTEGVSVAFSTLSATNDDDMQAMLTVRSSSGLQTSGSTAVDFIYLRAVSSTAVEVGLKSGEFGSNIAASTVTTGTLGVTVFYV